MKLLLYSNIIIIYITITIIISAERHSLLDRKYASPRFTK